MKRPLLHKSDEICFCYLSLPFFFHMARQIYSIPIEFQLWAENLYWNWSLLPTLPWCGEMIYNVNNCYIAWNNTARKRFLWRSIMVCFCTTHIYIYMYIYIYTSYRNIPLCCYIYNCSNMLHTWVLANIAICFVILPKQYPNCLSCLYLSDLPLS